MATVGIFIEFIMIEQEFTIDRLSLFHKSFSVYVYWRYEWPAIRLW